MAFTWHLSRARILRRLWKDIAPVKIGGPAFGKPSGRFTSGMYLKSDYVITSRGCPRRCWFCDAWKREKTLRELSICDGWNILDDNLLACSEKHVRSVFGMLKKQNHAVEFTGGLEARFLRSWHVVELRKLKIKQMFFAYDTPDDYQPLVRGSKMLHHAGFKRPTLRCYVLIGYEGDTMLKAERRLQRAMHLGFMPFAMLWHYRDGTIRDKSWVSFQREWAIQ